MLLLFASGVTTASMLLRRPQSTLSNFAVLTASRAALADSFMLFMVFGRPRFGGLKLQAKPAGARLNEVYECRPIREPRDFPGIYIERDREDNTTDIVQEAQAKEMLSKFAPGCSIQPKRLGLLGLLFLQTGESNLWLLNRYAKSGYLAGLQKMNETTKAKGRKTTEMSVM
ncbi:hypothetical protein B0I35DRAFT_415030 [Stachybotrys elegans]|uniref:Uncharacterized protein n=1 Tax=Stachybotrys elegans TaxID=80388 RepID=A0A8K0SGQ9_9HYPO|nr:hypothetical protein B0I35DRAFT_415030 [Stachybotrys elegans]